MANHRVSWLDVLTLLTVLGGVAASLAQGATICTKRNGVLALRETCKPRETRVSPAALGLRDPFGDGAGGARVFDTDDVLANTPLQFTDFTVSAGVTLVVPSGTVIRCSGTFTNEGTIVVEPSAAGARRSVITPEFTTARTEIAAHPGLATAGAQSGDFGDSSAPRFGGAGAPGIGPDRARTLLQPGFIGGGGGGAAGLDLIDGVTADVGANGGGVLVVIAAGAIVIRGTVVADGDGGTGGGGAGGLIVFASRTRIELAPSALLRAAGGAGENGDSNEAPSGGGGGGIVHLLAPVIDDLGATEVSGGAEGTLSSFALSAVERGGGGGGGALGGNGGHGGGVEAGAAPPVSSAEAGSPGIALHTLVDPSGIL
jgi:hypothetical protein